MGIGAENQDIVADELVTTDYGPIVDVVSTAVLFPDVVHQSRYPYRSSSLRETRKPKSGN